MENDTIRLLRECDAGVRMGMDAIAQVFDYVHDPAMKSCLEKSRKQHVALQDEITELLHSRHDEGKEPGMLAKSMSFMKTNVKLSLDSSDEKVADLITDGCDMGTKSLRKYQNEYKAADERAKEITKKLIALEEQLRMDMAAYL